jgi:hypothetical protein
VEQPGISFIGNDRLTGVVFLEQRFQVVTEPDTQAQDRLVLVALESEDFLFGFLWRINGRVQQKVLSFFQNKIRVTRSGHLKEGCILARKVLYPFIQLRGPESERLQVVFETTLG